MSGRSRAVIPYDAARVHCIRELLIEVAGGRCERCGYWFPTNTRDATFHHRNPRHKSFTLSGPDLQRPIESVLHEFLKCALLCTDCHKEVHTLKIARFFD